MSSSSSTHRLLFAVAGLALLASLAAAYALPLRSTRTNDVTSSASASQATPTPPSSAPQIKKRDLAGYVKGAFIIEKDISKKAHRAALAQVRGALLNQWQGRKKAHVEVTSYTPAGLRKTSHFYVEPDEKGRWRIALEAQGEPEYFYVVEEVELPEDGPPVLNPEVRRGRKSGMKGLHLKSSPEAGSGMVL